MTTVKVGGYRIEGVDLFVFDKDGTLIDLYNYWYHMVELRARLLCEQYDLITGSHKNALMCAMGIDQAQGRLNPNGPVGLFPREVVQKAAEGYLSLQGCANVSDTCFAVFKDVDAASLTMLDRFIKPLDGAVSLLQAIKKKGSKVAIATTDKTERAEMAVRFLRVESLVDMVVGTDQVRCSKPSPDMLLVISERLGVPPSHSVVIGDARTDIQMGINAQYKASIAVASGLTGREELASLTPYVVDDVSRIHLE